MALEITAARRDGVPFRIHIPTQLVASPAVHDLIIASKLGDFAEFGKAVEALAAADLGLDFDGPTVTADGSGVRLTVRRRTAHTSEPVIEAEIRIDSVPSRDDETAVDGDPDVPADPDAGAVTALIAALEELRTAMLADPRTQQADDARRAVVRASKALGVPVPT